MSHASLPSLTCELDQKRGTDLDTFGNTNTSQGIDQILLGDPTEIKALATGDDRFRYFVGSAVAKTKRGRAALLSLRSALNALVDNI